MAKHLGTRPERRPFPFSSAQLVRAAVWGLGGLLAAGAVTAIIVGQELGEGAPGQASPAASELAAHGAHYRAAYPKAGASQRRVDVSRQATRPRPAYRVMGGQRLTLRPAVVLARKISALSPARSTFTVAQSNILGSQHTTGRGGFASGPYRAGLTASLVTSRGVDVGGMQEVQANQLSVLLGRMPSYSFWPASSLGHNGLRLQIYWRSDRFTMVRSGSVTYEFASQRIPLPYVLLRDDHSGAEFWVITTHNSAGNLQGQRDYSTGIEINLIDQLEATGLPVVITGDMNEHTAFFCRVSTSTGMVAANGGSGVGGCHLPPPPLRVDWIMGGGRSGSSVTFSGYRQDAAGLNRASDHYYLYAEATTTSEWFAPGTSPAGAPGTAH